MKKDQDQTDNQDEVESNTDDQSPENESSDDEYQRDESNRGERPGHLRQRSDWFQKRTGGR